MDFMSTVKGSLLEGFYPEGWDMAKIDACCEKGVAREAFWNPAFSPVECKDIHEFDVLMGHEIAMQIKLAKEAGQKLAMILPVGPMGMYRWASYFINEWKVSCDHVYTFNMDEWSDADGNTSVSMSSRSFGRLSDNDMGFKVTGDRGTMLFDPDTLGGFSGYDGIIRMALKDIDASELTQAQKDAIILSKKEYEAEAKGGTIQVSFESNVEVTVTADCDWIKVNTTSARSLATTTITMEISENTTTDKRTGHVTISNGTLSEMLTVTQKGKDPTNGSIDNFEEENQEW